MPRNLRILAIGGMWIAGGLATALGAPGIRAQEVLELPAEDSPLSADFAMDGLTDSSPNCMILYVNL